MMFSLRTKGKQKKNIEKKHGIFETKWNQIKPKNSAKTTTATANRRQAD